MKLKNPFRPRRRETFGEPLYALAVEQARRPEFYEQLGVEDRIDARFELYTLHVLILVMRLRDEGPDGAEVAQALFDAYVSALDHTLRELGVGDLSMSKKMRKLGESLFGRMATYEPALAAADSATLASAVARNVYESDDAARGEALTRYALACRASLAAQPYDQVSVAPAWAEVTA